ncbi:MAG TPA: hypothetical protein VGF45_23115 [Polyangia bacterium]
MKPRDPLPSPLSTTRTTPAGARPAAEGAAAGGFASDFLLRHHQALVRRISPTVRADLIGRHALALQKLQAAQILWASEQTAEAWQLAETALGFASAIAGSAAGLAGAEADATNVAAGDADPGSLDASTSSSSTTARGARALTRLGAHGPAIRMVERAAALMAACSAPVRNAEVTADHRRAFAAMTKATAILLDAARPFADSPTTVVLRRFARIGTLALIVLVVVLGLQRAFAVDERFTVSASASFDPATFSADKATDGDPKTEWLLPSRSRGWIEAKFSRRDLRQIHVRNAQNRPHADRGTRGFRVELYREGNLVHSSKHAFTRFGGDPEELDLLIKAEDVDAIRIMVDEFHKVGGGLSEFRWR